jgi:hypothetical protein
MAVVVQELEMAPPPEPAEQSVPAQVAGPPPPRLEDELARVQERERVLAMRLRAS